MIPGKFWFINNFPFQKGKSLSDYILKDEFSLKYVRGDKIISCIQELGQGVYFPKIDIENAFRLILLAPLQWSLLSIFWESRFCMDTR